MISDTITQKIGESMKAKDETRLSTLRMLSSALNYEKIAKQHELNDEEELAVVRREAKKRTDAIEAFQNAVGKHTTSTPEELKQKLEKEKKELEILNEYLPLQLTDDELQKIVDETVSGFGTFTRVETGKIIGLVMSKVKGKADGARVAKLVTQKLAVS